jgi:chaperonin GroEL (HSP60 family)
VRFWSLAPYFINNQANQTAEFEIPYILLFDKDKLEGSNEDLAIGIKLPSRAIEGPLRRIAAHAGEYGDMLDMGDRGGMGCMVERLYRSMNEARGGDSRSCRVI